ncbi:MAG: hypothetical protein ACRD3W_31225, partial [Terriglobales bacterium]
VDLRGSSVVEWSDFARIIHPAAKLVAQGHMADIYTVISHAPQQVSELSRFPATYAPEVEQFREMPLVAWIMQQFGAWPVGIGLLIWHIYSLACLALSVYLITQAAAHVELEAEDSADVGWACMSFAPLLLLLFQGQVGIAFGLLPLAAGYYLLIKNKPGFAGLVWALTILKPAYLLVPLANVIVQIMARRTRLAIAFGVGLALILGFTTMVSGDAFKSWLDVAAAFGVQNAQDARLDVSMVHAVLVTVPPVQQGPLFPIAMFVGGIIAVGGFMQINQVMQSDEKDRWLVPFATMLGAFLTPVLLPHLPFADLTALVIAGLVVHCMEWREHLEWRMMSIVRVNWIIINAYFILYYFFRNICHPAELIVFLLLFYRRLVEVVRFVAHTPEFE